ncbi:MAG: valine--tRNA ligase [Crocosphaera sp.]|uniref:Valine--tRNA ligase n=5 Tax=Crocosphaera TaxID=263510 RepID=G5J5P0_CROWT|nr:MULTISPECIES: valine--tRNA ligase [Crocosphaera]EHJ12495.1 Valyl-tRNA synthetase [Crocosphaera watsonii WH 0003]MCH2247581.1 valine--tRNA ligase [Crocosphaera sp.]CCQ56893.1 Valyl-tRNA synthetase [Crocosphaera watsonii WH 0005]CCQ60125.1 Valyl-tRNA synthetase [Crocosphaera watsonii WH 0401]
MTASIPELPTQYDPKTTEAKWQEAWSIHQVFQADNSKDGETYCIVIPPPNVTGTLHMGHAFGDCLMDVLIRYHRMCGHNTLCLPGTDHASIAVHTILDKQLKAEGLTRQDIGREKFLEKAWQWKQESGGQIVNQMKRIGLSADWSRERFTLDEGLSKAVKTAFIKLYEAGLIYRGNYLVNWCPASLSAVSDVEVESKEVDGHLWHFRYPLSDNSGHVEVATTRPETMLGDTGVAVNPNDERYKNLLGKTITLPIVGREIPIFADELVDPEFGTGCVKVTPAHDPNDFEMGNRHQLPFINIMNKDGTLNENAGIFAGQDRFVARKNVIKKLEEDGFLIKTENYSHAVPYSDRGKVPVEPLLSTQWFVKMEPLAKKALKCLDENNSPNFVPQRWKKVYRDWLVKLKDWCISRQLWWGHQIPAWYVISETNGEITDNTPFIVANSEVEALEKAKQEYGDNIKLEQDPDVLDTWFSSGLWPFSTLGWPENTEDLKTYYPTSTLVTGFDIIFFWVARMTMMAGYFTDEMPFKDVYIHGLVRDENGKKMSKTANNGIDPLILIDKYGTDALRYTLIRDVAGAGQDISLQYDRKTDQSESVEASRNFANKLWNAARFVMMHLKGETPQSLGTPEIDKLELCDRWILSRFHQTVQQTRKQIEAYGLGEAAKGLYEFIWGDFCDWYIELVKTRLWQETPSRDVARQTLAYILDGTLKLLHPFMPHITEEIWQTLSQSEGQFIPVQAYPEVDNALINTDLETSFTLLFETIRTLRNMRAEADIKPGVKVSVILQSENEQERTILESGRKYIQDVGKVETLTITPQLEQQTEQVIAGVVGTIQALIPLTGVVDIASLRAKLEKSLAKIEAEIKSLSGRLNNPGFVNKAPEAVVQGARDALAEAQKQAEILRERLKRLQ